MQVVPSGSLVVSTPRNQKRVTVSEDFANEQELRPTYTFIFIHQPYYPYLFRLIIYAPSSAIGCYGVGRNCSNGLCHLYLQNYVPDSRCFRFPPAPPFISQNVTVVTFSESILGTCYPGVSGDVSKLLLDMYFI